MTNHRSCTLMAALTLAACVAPVLAEGSEKKAKPPTVAVLPVEGVELLDFAGPAEVFGVAGEGKSFRVVTVGEATEPVHRGRGR